MLQFRTIKNSTHKDFDLAWSLYENAFPQEERRRRVQQEQIMPLVHYHFELIFDKKVFVGILLWWQLEGMRYIEHLATLPERRGQNYGKRIMNSFIKRNLSPIILEVEKPESELQQRRVGFYQRLGFALNDHTYHYPPYTIGDIEIPLKIMSYPRSISLAEMNHFQALLNKASCVKQSNY